MNYFIDLTVKKKTLHNHRLILLDLCVIAELLLSQSFLLLRTCGLFWFSFCFVFCLFRASAMAYGVSQARGRIGARATNLHHSHSNVGSQPCLCPTYTTAHGNVRSLSHWAKPGIKPASSWIPVKCLTHWSTTGIPHLCFLCCLMFIVSICLSYLTRNALPFLFLNFQPPVHSICLIYICWVNE